MHYVILSWRFHFQEKYLDRLEDDDVFLEALEDSLLQHSGLGV
jgi:hypothetical protein